MVYVEDRNIKMIMDKNRGYLVPSGEFQSRLTFWWVRDCLLKCKSKIDDNIFASIRVINKWITIRKTLKKAKCSTPESLIYVSLWFSVVNKDIYVISM